MELCSKIITLADVCRTCLKRTDNMKLLTNGTNEVLEIITKLSSVLNFEVVIDNSLPKFLCSKCEEKINFTYEFQQLCKKSYELIEQCITTRNIPFDFKNEEIIDYSEPSIEYIKENNDNSIKYVESDFDKIPRKTERNQVMRLTQFSSEEVNRVISTTRGRAVKSNCLCCGFTAKDGRALSVHMSRLHKSEKLNWCCICNERFDNLEDHSKNIHKDDFKCPLCQKYLSNTGHFMEHLASHTTERKFICDICQKSFISARHLKSHHRIHSQRRFYNCPFCTKTFLIKKSLNLHMKIHHKHKCKVCLKSFIDTKNYEAHKCFVKDEIDGGTDNKQLGKRIESYSSNEAQNFCIKCNKRVRSLQTHLKSFHLKCLEKQKKEQSSLCTYCGKQFKYASKLSVHLRIHTGESPYKCSYCDVSSTTRGHLVVHERTHTGEKPHICTVCGKGFAQSSVLNTHMKLHTGRPEQCIICSKRFCRPSELRLHMRKHTGEKPFLCTQCGSSFKQRSHLVDHYRTHTNDRPFKCEVCDKTFKKSSTLKMHVNIHLGNKPYKCLQCPFATRQSFYFNQHMAQHENNSAESGNELHRCAVCQESFSTLDLFTAHYTSSHEPLTVASNIDLKEDFIEVE